jgi:hypothetical protein
VNWPDVPELWSILSLCEERWRYTYPALNIEAEVLRMGEWIEANQRRAPKKNYKAFMVRWLARSQASIERAEAREMIQREQMRADASVGKFGGYR